MGKVIGIDLGTTNSAVAVHDAKQPSIILSPEGDRLLPSVVSFSRSDDRLVGNPAKGQMITNPQQTVYAVKRLMGKRFSEIEPFLDHYTYEITCGDDDTIKIKINDQHFSPEEISAIILHRLKESAEQYLGEKVEGAIITVPAYFNDSQRAATRDAAEIAGLKVLRIINEPTAAALAFSVDMKEKSTVVVYDFGGGTIDVSFLEVDKEVIKVEATAGNSSLGGNDLDQLLIDLVIDEFRKEYDIDLSDNKLAIQRIHEAVEAAKKELSSLDACEINLPFMADTEDGPIHYLRYLTRSEFENLIEQKVDQTIEIFGYLMENAGIDKNDIGEILLVGGSTRIPLVQKKVKEFFNREPNKKINPDEIVAMGAAIQGAVASGHTKDILLLDVIPLSLGVKTLGNAFTSIIDANTTIPTEKSLVFSTAEDNQEEVEINIYQGIEDNIEKNKSLGKFTLTGIKKAPKGVPRIEVTFNVNINGILTVSAIDLSSQSKREIIVSDTGLLKKEEKESIKKSQQKYSEGDSKRRDSSRNKGTILNFIYSLDQFLVHLDLDKSIQDECNGLIKRANEVLEKESDQEMDRLIRDMEEVVNRLESVRAKQVKQKKPSTAKKRDDTRPLTLKRKQEAAGNEKDEKIPRDTHPFKIIDK